MKRLFRLVYPALIVFSATAFAGEKEKESLYAQLNRGIIRLEHNEVIHQENADANIPRNVPDGTAFFVHSGGELYVVSARHVVEQAHDLHARVKCRNEKTGEEEVILLELPRKSWVYHPKYGDKDTHFVDVATTKIPWIKERSIKAFRYEPKDSNDHDKNHLPYEDPEPPDPILVFGFPDHVGFELLEQRPFARLGIISMRTEKEFLKYSINSSNKFAEERCCLIDAHMFPGNSGSPVMNQPRFGTSKPQLLGLVIATNTMLDFGIIEPVSRIRETLDIVKKRPASGNWKPIHKKETEQTSTPEI